VVECLKSRGILRVSGKEASSFMQGLITNDMRHLEEGVQSMYTTFLNTKGRVMYDAIIYQSKEENVFLIECDKSAISHLQKHLKLFRVRRKIDIDNVEDELKVWVVFDPNLADTDETNVNKMKNILQGQILSPTIESPIDESIIKELEKHTDNTIVCRDPRLSTLGVRIVAPASEDISLQNDRGESVYQGNNMSYRAFRYKLGIGEGVNDLPPENCFPLEANGDYLHGVSFHKGCYIGQELTARTHHTGVVLKLAFFLLYSITFIPMECDNSKSENPPRDATEGGIFTCVRCGLKEHYFYKGKKPPFTKKISFREDSYVMKDPFSPPNKNQLLLLGSDCSLCNIPVC
ncbi:Putative transferase C1orf69-like protein, mitochondrial, partial [Zootermopsis nevadensis]